MSRDDKNSATPRTDAAKFDPAPGTHGHEWVYADHARQLERDLAEVTVEVIRYREQEADRDYMAEQRASAPSHEREKCVFCGKPYNEPSGAPTHPLGCRDDHVAAPSSIEPKDTGKFCDHTQAFDCPDYVACNSNDGKCLRESSATKLLKDAGGELYVLDKDGWPVPYAFAKWFDAKYPPDTYGADPHREPMREEYQAVWEAALRTAQSAIAPRTVWLVSNKTSMMLFDSQESARKYVSRFGAATAGGMSITNLEVFSATDGGAEK